MKKLLLSIAMLAFAVVSCDNQQSVDTTTKETITIGINTSDAEMSYSSLSDVRSTEGASLLAIQVYEGETPIAKGLFDDWSSLSFEGYTNTTYKVIATMIVDAKTAISSTNGTYALPFNAGISANLESSSEAFEGLASSTATLAIDGVAYITPNIDRYYGESSKTVTAEDAVITTSMKRVSFGVATKGVDSDVVINIAGAPEVTISSSEIALFSLNDISAAYNANETDETYSETMATSLSLDGSMVYSGNVTFKRNALASIYANQQNGSLGFDFETPFEDEVKVLTFEDVDYVAGANYIGQSSWSSLIDNAQYGGLLLYGEGGMGVTTPYQWTDTDNTFLHNEIIDTWGMGTFEFWNGGVVISNYYTEVVSGLSYDTQLSVACLDSATGGSGNNGSQNFAVVNADIYSQTSLNFADGSSRTIKYMYIANTSFALSVCEFGDSMADKLGSEDTFWVTITGYDISGTQVGEVTFELSEGGVAKEGWNKCDLSSLGAVNKIGFKINSSVQNAYGSVIPSYIAIDDIAVGY